MKFRQGSLQELVGSSIYNIIRQGGGALLGFITSIILAKSLGTENRGVYALIVLFPITAFNFVNLGIPTSITYFVARKDYDFSVMFVGNLLISIVLSALGFGVAFLFLKLGGEYFLPNLSPQLLIISVSLIPLMIFNANLLGMFIGLQDFKRYNAFDLISNIVFLVLLACFVVFTRLDVVKAIFSNIASYFISTILIFIVLQREHPINKKMVSFGVLKDFIVSSVSYGFKTYFQNMISFLNFRSDKYLLNYFSGSSSLGLYDISVGFAEQLWFISRSLSSVLYPKISSLKDNMQEGAHLTAFVTSWTIWLSAAGSLLAFFLVDLVVPLFFGVEFTGVSLGFKYLLPGIVTASGSRLLTQYIAASGRPQVNAIHSMIGLILNVSINLFLIPRMGLVGASLTSSISYSVVTIIKAGTFCTMTGISWTALIIPQFKNGSGGNPISKS